MRITGKLVAAWATVLVLGGVAPAVGGGDPGRDAKAERRRWASAKMDEMANERLRCRERFTGRADVERCETDHARRFRQYNDIYLEASRE
jgi:hypothetical protein